jgi:hypothetical protein
MRKLHAGDVLPTVHSVTSARGHCLIDLLSWLVVAPCRRFWSHNCLGRSRSPPQPKQARGSGVGSVPSIHRRAPPPHRPDNLHIATCLHVLTACHTSILFTSPQKSTQPVIALKGALLPPEKAVVLDHHPLPPPSRIQPQHSHTQQRGSKLKYILLHHTRAAPLPRLANVCSVATRPISNRQTSIFAPSSLPPSSSVCVNRFSRPHPGHQHPLDLADFI